MVTFREQQDAYFHLLTKVEKARVILGVAEQHWLTCENRDFNTGNKNNYTSPQTREARKACVAAVANLDKLEEEARTAHKELTRAKLQEDGLGDLSDAFCL